MAAFTFSSVLIMFWFPLISLATSPTSRSTREDTKGISFFNDGDFQYILNLTLGNQEFFVSIDTGSTDLWVAPPTPISHANITDIQVNETYGVGSLIGNITFAPLKIGPYSVPSQAFVNASTVVDMSGRFGIIGFGFETSRINGAVYNVTGNATLGRSALGNIFAQNPSLPNFLSMHLSRSDDLEVTQGGTFLISEDQDGFEHVKDMPRLPRFLPTDSVLPRWTVQLDGFSVNEKQLALNSSVKGAPEGKAIASLDTGTTFAEVPAALSELIYGSIPDAFFSANLSTWIVPCMDYSNVTFTFAGQQYAIHPIDLTMVQNQTLSDGSTGTYCVSAYPPITLSSHFTSTFDLLLGDSFLRNVYASFDYGEMDNSGSIVGDPFVQLLSTTDRDTAIGEFQKYRAETLKEFPPQVSVAKLRQIFGQDGESSDASVTVAADGATAASDSRSGMSSLIDRLNMYGPAVVGLLAGNLLTGLLLCLLGLAACMRWGGKTRREYATVPTRFRD